MVSRIFYNKSKIILWKGVYLFIYYYVLNVNSNTHFHRKSSWFVVTKLVKLFDEFVIYPPISLIIACIFLVISFMKIRFSDEASKSNDAGVLGFIKNRSSWRELIDLDAKTRLKKNHEYEICYIKLKGW